MRNLLLTFAALLAFAAAANAQPYVGCAHTRSNLQNSGNSITVDSTSGGVTVMGAATGTSQGRCAAGIKNSGSAAMRCASTGDGAPTTTNGFLLNAGESEILNFEGGEAYKCIRTTSTSTTADVLEALP